MKKFLLFALFSMFTAPLFLGAQQCISNVIMESGECEPGGFLTGYLFFDYSPNVDTVSVYYDNAYFGDHATSNLPIVLFPLQGDGIVRNVVVQDSEVSTCRDSLSYQPFCEPCYSEIISVSSYCLDTVQHLTVKYNFFEPVSEVHIRVNGEYVTNGMVGQNISQILAVQPSPNNVYEVEVLDPEFLSCSDVAFLQVSPCVEDCIVGFDTAGTSCNTDGTYNMSFFLNDSLGAANVYVDGQFEANIPASDSIDFYTLGQLVSDTISTTHDITVCLESNPSCCTTLSFDDPLCSITPECNVEISSTFQRCDQEGLFIDVNYTFENPFSEIHVYVNDVYYSNATVGTDLFLQIFIPNPEFIDYTIEIRDAELPSCSATAITQNINCDPCEAYKFTFAWDCNSDGTFNFIFENEDQQSPVSVYLDSLFIGVHSAGMPELIADSLEALAGSPILVSICSDIYDCCTENTLMAPSCEQTEDCTITNAGLEIQCLSGTSEFVALLTFDYTGVDSVKIQDYNGNLIGFYDVNQQPIAIPQTIGPDQTNSFGLVIYNASDVLCVTETPLYTVPCNDFCQLYWIEYEVLDCNPDGSYNAEILYGLESSNAQVIIAGVNGTIQDSIAVSTNNSFVLSNIVPQPGTNVDMLTLCVEGYPNCCFTIELERPVCEPVECSISNNTTEIICLGNGEYLANVVFESENTSGTLNYYLDDNLVGSSDDSQNVFTFGPFENGTPHFYSIEDAQNEACVITGDIFTQECVGQPEPCVLEFIEVDSLVCNADGTYDMLAVYAASNSISALVDVTVNGQFLGTYPNSGSVSLDAITPRAGTNQDIITICMNDEPDCCKTIEYAQVDCPEPQECLITERTVEYECLGNGEYLAYISYIAENTSNLYRLYIDGIFVEMIQSTSATIEAGPFVNGDQYSYKLEDSQNPNCVLEGDIFTQECVGQPEPCALVFIEPLERTCNNDGTFDMEVLYETVNAGNEFIDVFLNGDFFGFYQIDSTVRLENITLSLTNDIKNITICINDNPDCCKTVDYQQPECGDESCELDQLLIEYECNDDTGEIIPLLFFKYDTVNTTEVIVNIDDINVGFYDPTQQPIQLNPMMSNSATEWMITVIDAADESCFTSALLKDVDCGGECIIANLTAEKECLADGTVLVYLDFISNNTSGEVKINGNGNQYGVFDIASLPIELGPLDPTEHNVWEFVVTDININNCTAFIEGVDLDCNDVNEIECLVEGIEVYNIDCISDNEYSMSVDFEIVGNASIPFTFYHNGAQMNSTATASLPINLIGLVPSDSSGVETITICLEGLENCCFDYEYERPSCLSNTVALTLLDGVELSPNPTRDIININHIPQEVIGLNIVDNLGRSIQQMDASEDMRIDVSNFVEGIYIVQFFTADNKVMNKRFVKMK
jgi:hypothetical protein